MATASSSYSFLRPLLRGLPIIFVTALTGIFIAKKYLQYSTPLYESTAKIKLADLHEGVSNSNLYKDLDLFANTNKIGAEVELLKSKVLVTKAVRRLNIGTSIYRVGEMHKTELYNEAPFVVQAEITNEKWLDKPFAVTITGNAKVEVKVANGAVVHGGFDQVLSTVAGLFVFRKNEVLLASRPGLPLNDHYEVAIHSEDNLVNSIISGLDVMAVDKDIPVLRISYTSPVPQKAADVVNTLSAAYITDYIEEKFKSADTTADFLNRELKTYSARLSASEQAIEQYRNEKNIVNIRQETETDLRKIADLKKQAASLQMNLTAIDSLNGYIQNGKENFLTLAPNFEAFTDLLSTELVKKTKELQRERQDLLLLYTSENEKVKVVDDKLSDINHYFVESIGNTRKSLQTQHTNLQQTIAQAERVFIGLPTREKTMTILERNFGLNEQIFRFLSEKRTEAEIARAATISFHRIISPGDVPVKAVSPNVPVIKIMAAILGLLSGVGLVYSVHALKGRVSNEETINRLSATPVTGAVPFCKTATKAKRFFQQWALELELKQNLSEGSVIVVSSFSAKEGKEFISEGLNRAVNAMGKKVRLLDAVEVVNTEGEGFEAWANFLLLQQSIHDIVIVNNLEIDNHATALTAMANASLNLLLLDSRRTKKSRITEADLLAEEFQLPNLKFVLNRAGYTPSLYTQTKNVFTSLIKKFQR